jgi:hypothetical protein
MVVCPILAKAYGALAAVVQRAVCFSSVALQSIVLDYLHAVASSKHHCS